MNASGTADESSAVPGAGTLRGNPAVNRSWGQSYSASRGDRGVGKRTYCRLGKDRVPARIFGKDPLARVGLQRIPLQQKNLIIGGDACVAHEHAATFSKVSVIAGSTTLLSTRDFATGFRQIFGIRDNGSEVFQKRTFARRLCEKTVQHSVQAGPACYPSCSDRVNGGV